MDRPVTVTRYLLDTTTVIDFARKLEPLTSRFIDVLASPAEVGICAITLTEFYAGLPLAELAAWEVFFDPLEYWTISPSAAIRAGSYRYTFSHRGMAIATTDALLAAVAVDVGAILLTSNTKDFPMDDVTLRDLRTDEWRIAAEGIEP